ncbi:DUF4389 domain-containing protein [Aliiruegeria sabulilitoris]|uniref:DUF4389 domain-containing protein n=1 Tax=Aliiruegeria sabulilitoris TaxID=1510458 RepID=UPI00082B5567|nr:DUF4389 domain-containing protein [Aliiruegeria sabulilitoris]NDR59591.1 DUF4389 domain-containing protein [Pseudoruegeria sp. M32A2M]
MRNENIDGRIHGPQQEPGGKDSLFLRLVYMLLIYFMIGIANTILAVATLVQIVIMLLNKHEPNPRLADFGTDLGIWIAKAARYQVAASEVKPWPWTELD